MERQRPSYQTYLEEAEGEVLELIREAENLEFHHAPEGSVEGVHYRRLMNMMEVIHAQAAKLPRREYSLEERAKQARDPVDD